MTGVIVASIIGGVALVVLSVIGASVLGPLSSLRRTAARFEEVEAETARLRRNLEVLRARAEELRRKRT